MFDHVLIAALIVAFAAIAGPTIATKFGPELAKIQAKADADIAVAKADAEKYVAAIKQDASASINKVSSDYSAMHNRAVAAENELAVLKKYLPSSVPQAPATTTQLSPAELSAATAQPAVVAAGMAAPVSPPATI